MYTAQALHLDFQVATDHTVVILGTIQLDKL